MLLGWIVAPQLAVWQLFFCRLQQGVFACVIDVEYLASFFDSRLDRSLFLAMDCCTVSNDRHAIACTSVSSNSMELILDSDINLFLLKPEEIKLQRTVEGARFVFCTLFFNFT